MESALGYFALLAATLAIEVPVAAWLAGRGARSDVCAAALWLNFATHPAATALIGIAGAPWAAVELALATAEAVGYCALTPLGRGRASAIAALANALSAGLGIGLARVA